MKNTPQKSRFAVPIALTVAAHAFLFFGFQAPRHTNPGSKATPAPAVPVKQLPILVDLTPQEDTRRDRVSEPKARPPLGPDVLGDPKPSDFRTPYEPVDPKEHSNITTLLPVVWNAAPGLESGRIVFHPGQLDRAPRAEFRLAPQYPAQLRAQGIAGEVMIDFLVDENGRVSDIHVLSSTNSAFEAPTLKAVAKWRFEPGRRNGQPVRFRMAIPLRFTLDQ